MKVLDLTLCSGALGCKVRGWKVSEEESLSDHRQLIYWLALDQLEVLNKRTPWNTNWDAFREELRGRLRELPTKYGMIDELDILAEHLQTQRTYIRSAFVKGRSGNLWPRL